MVVATGKKTGRKTMTLRARWSGEPPAVGDYLMGSGGRVRSAYRIVCITPRASVLELEVDKVSPTSVPDGATVHDWRWDARSSRNGAAWS